MENATMQIDGQITKVQIESPTLCGTMSSSFPFRKMKSLSKRDEIFKRLYRIVFRKVNPDTLGQRKRFEHLVCAVANNRQLFRDENL